MFKVELLHGKGMIHGHDAEVKSIYAVAFRHRRQILSLEEWEKIHKGVARKIEKGEIESLQEREVCWCTIYRKFDDDKEAKPQAILETIAVCHPLDEKKYDRKQGRKEAFAQAVFELFGGPIRGTNRRKDFNKLLFYPKDIELNGGLKAIREMFWASFFANVTMPGFKRVIDFTAAYSVKRIRPKKQKVKS